MIAVDHKFSVKRNEGVLRLSSCILSFFGFKQYIRKVVSYRNIREASLKSSEIAEE